MLYALIHCWPETYQYALRYQNVVARKHIPTYLEKNMQLKPPYEFVIMLNS